MLINFKNTDKENIGKINYFENVFKNYNITDSKYFQSKLNIERKLIVISNVILLFEIDRFRLKSTYLSNYVLPKLSLDITKTMIENGTPSVFG